MNSGDVAPFLAFLVLASGVTLTLVLRGPIGKALARRLEGKGASVGEAEERLIEMEERIHHLEAIQERVAELEERLDFAERLLVAGGERSAPDKLRA